MHTNYIQLPPDSTGKKLLVGRVILLTVNDSSGIKRGDIITTSVTNNVLRCSASVVVGGAHMIHAMYVAEAQEAAVEVQSGEHLLVGGVDKATITTTPYYEYFNYSANVSADNPYHGQLVDNRGQAYTRFAEGSPSMDAFGNLRIGEAYCVGSYDYAHGDSADLFQDLNTAGGSVTHNPSTSDTSLAVTNTLNASVSRTTVRYHHYQPGVSNLIVQTLVHGDAGKANHRRRWGYFDPSYGMYWELDGTTLYACIRSDTLGTTFKIAQADWNKDTMDGVGISGQDLDITKANFYFIDFAWLGVGEVRFGILGPNGERNICHIFQNPNTHVSAYMHAGCAPLRWEVENYGVSLPGSGSEMRSICSAVYSQSRVDYTFWRYADIKNMTGVTLTDATPKPILSMRVRFGSHVGLYPESVNVLVEGGSVALSVVDDGTLTGGTWTNSGAMGEGNVGATAISGGAEFYSIWVDAGAHHIELAEYYELNDEGYHRLPDGSDSYVFTLVATKLTGTSVTVKGELTYKELR